MRCAIVTGMNNKKTELSPSQELLKLAKSKWGRRWRPKAAKALDVHPVTLWRWVQADGNPPLAVLLAMRAMRGKNIDADADDA